MARKEVSCKKLEIFCKKGSTPFTARSSSRRGTCLLARSVQLSNLINLGEQDFFTWPPKENSGPLISEILCTRQGFRHWTYGNRHAQVRILCSCRKSDFVLSFVQARIKVQDDARIDPRIITCIGSIGERPRTPVLMTATEDSGRKHSSCQVYAPASMVLLALFFLLCVWCMYVKILTM